MTSAEKLIKLLSTLPGVGEKTASRYAAFIARQPESWTQQLSAALLAVEESSPCQACCAPCDSETCDICRRRPDAKTICVVQSEADIPAIESVGGMEHTYHVLGGLLAPLDGIGPDDLNIDQLLDRIRETEPSEVILALAPSMEGDTTASYLASMIDIATKVTRIARGLPIGSSVEHTDKATLGAAFSRRVEE